MCSKSDRASAGAGIITVNAGTAALMFFIVTTPAGWVGLVVVSAAASMGMNYVVKEKSGGWYDQIMEWVSSW